MRPRILRIFVGVLFLVLSMQVVFAQDTEKNPVKITGIALDESQNGLKCIALELSVTDFANKMLAISAIPIYKLDGKAAGIKNTSGDPKDTASSGIVVSNIFLKNEKPVVYWDKDHGGGVRVCVNTEHFPISEKGFDYYIVLGFYDGDNGTFLGSYDTTADFGFLNYPGFKEKIRITNIQHHPDLSLVLGKEPESGETITVTFEAFGYKDKQLTVQMFPVKTDGDYVLSIGEDKDHTSSEGRLFDKQIVVPTDDDSTWIDGPDTQALSFFLPYSAFPLGTYDWHLTFSVSVKGEKIPIFQLEDSTVIGKMS